MGQRELLLVLGAIALFGITIFNTNRHIVDQNEDMIRREFEYYAISLAKSYLEEARAKPFFDESLNGGSPAVPAGFTDPGLLGPEGEVHPNFNDVDDFNGYTTIDTARSDFSISIEVGYVDGPNWGNFVNYKTRFKTMKVTVSEDLYLFSTVQLNGVYSYVPL